MNFSVIITHRQEQYTIQFYENAVRCTPVISIYEWPISEFRMQWSRNEFDGFAAFFLRNSPTIFRHNTVFQNNQQEEYTYAKIFKTGNYLRDYDGLCHGLRHGMLQRHTECRRYAELCFRSSTSWTSDHVPAGIFIWLFRGWADCKKDNLRYF